MTSTTAYCEPGSTECTCDPNAVTCDSGPGDPAPYDTVIPSPDPGNGDRGINIFQETRNWNQVYQVNVLREDLVLPWPACTLTYNHKTRKSECLYLPRHLYSPTLLAPGGACLEVTQVYRREGLAFQQENLLQVWDWCTDSTSGLFDGKEARFINTMRIDDVFKAKHVRRNNDGQQQYAITVTASTSGEATIGGCWDATLYNYLAGVWDPIGHVCGRPIRNFGVGPSGNMRGWTMWESHNVTTDGCRSFPNISARHIFLSVVTPGGESGSTLFEATYDWSNLVNSPCFANGPYGFRFTNELLRTGSTWQAQTGIP